MLTNGVIASNSSHLLSDRLSARCAFFDIDGQLGYIVGKDVMNLVPKSIRRSSSRRDTVPLLQMRVLLPIDHISFCAVQALDVPF